MQPVDSAHHPFKDPELEKKYKFPTPKDDFIESQKNPYVQKMKEDLLAVNNLIAHMDSKIRDGSQSEESLAKYREHVRSSKHYRKQVLKTLKEFGVHQEMPVQAGRVALDKRDRTARFDRKFHATVDKMVARTAHKLEESHGKKRTYLRNKLNTVRFARKGAALKTITSMA
jgi:hypothetical protein